MTDPTAAEKHRLALSEALGLGTGAPWDAIRDRAAELNAASTVGVLPASGAVREQLLNAIDFSYCQTLGFGTPEGLLAAYEASRTQTVDQAAVRERVAEALKRAPFKELRTEGGSPNGPLEITALVDDLADAALGAVLPATTNHDTDTNAELATARATNQRLNREKQQLESELATYRRAVAQWEINERGTYIPHSSLRAIGLAPGRDILGSVRHLKHFERVEEAEAANEQLRAERAAVLREAADRAETVALRLRLKHDYGAANGAYEVMAELRRVADETAATETTRLLDCGLCYEEQGEDVHPHPECTVDRLAELEAEHERWVRVHDLVERAIAKRASVIDTWQVEDALGAGSGPKARQDGAQ
ncbi:hypothetical protein [Streptomyces tendae]|uniref:hypothetical protein n=1 Tax=Streptomyces tendae TaxID=1932 RepID=UPI00364E9BB2